MAGRQRRLLPLVLLLAPPPTAPTLAGVAPWLIEPAHRNCGTEPLDAIQRAVQVWWDSLAGKLVYHCLGCNARGASSFQRQSFTRRHAGGTDRTCAKLRALARKGCIFCAA